jgi:hypothetical protein
MWRGAFNRRDRSINSGTSVISPGQRVSTNSSCTIKMASSRSARSLARVDFPAAILPHRPINFAPLFMSSPVRATCEVTGGCSASRARTPLAPSLGFTLIAGHQ